jgi:hypothetical protein
MISNKDSRVSNKISKSFIDKEANMLENPDDYRGVLGVGDYVIL